METEIKYGLRHKEHGRLARYSRSRGDSYDTFSFTDSRYEGFPIFMTSRLTNIVRIFEEDIFDYDSSEDLPSNRYPMEKMSEFFPVQITIRNEFDGLGGDAVMSSTTVERILMPEYAKGVECRDKKVASELPYMAFIDELSAAAADEENGFFTSVKFIVADEPPEEGQLFVCKDRNLYQIMATHHLRTGDSEIYALLVNGDSSKIRAARTVPMDYEEELEVSAPSPR